MSKEIVVKNIKNRFNIAMMLILLAYQKNDTHRENTINITSLEVNFILNTIKHAKKITTAENIEYKNEKSIIIETIKLCDYVVNSIKQSMLIGSINLIDTLIHRYDNIVENDLYGSCIYIKEGIEEILKDIEIMQIMEEINDIAIAFGINLNNELDITQACVLKNNLEHMLMQTNKKYEYGLEEGLLIF